MARKHRPSDVTAKYRKRLKRRIAKLETAASRAEGRKREIIERTNLLKDLLQQTYNMPTEADRKAVFSQIEQAAPSARGRSRRSDAAFKRKLNEMNQARTKEDLVKSKVFWMATKDSWLGYDRHQRADRIKKAFGVDTLQEAYDMVMDSHKADIDRMLSALSVYDDQGRMATTDDLIADAEDPYDAIKPYLVYIR